MSLRNEILGLAIVVSVSCASFFAGYQYCIGVEDPIGCVGTMGDVLAKMECVMDEVDKCYAISDYHRSHSEMCTTELAQNVELVQSAMDYMELTELTGGCR